MTVPTPRATAADRLRRLLAMIPWLAGRDGPTVEEVLARFGLTRRQLEEDLDLLMVVGVPPYTPDELFEMTIEDGRVFARLTPSFDRPLRLSPDEALAVVVAGRAVADVPGADPAGPLARALAKVAGVLGVEGDDVLDIDLGPVAEPTLAALQQAVLDRRQVVIDYYALGRDERAERTVDPWLVVNDAGAWYLVGHDHRSAARRTFRIDRVVSVRVLDEGFDAPADPPVAGMFSATADAPRVTLELDDAGRWVADAYPVEAAEVVDGATIRVVLAVTATPWLERLLLRLGPHGRVVDGPAELVAAGASAAARVLARYGEPAPPATDRPAPPAHH